MENLDNKKREKINIKANTKSKDFITNLKKFYFEHIKKLHVIMLVIMLVIFVITFISSIVSYNNGATSVSGTEAVNAFSKDLKNALGVSAVLIFAGITPYFYISVLGVAESIAMVSDMVLRYAYHISFAPTLFIGGLIQIIGYSLCIAVGMYYCRLSSIKRKYYNQSSFTMDDVKEQFYSLKQDQKKLKEIENKKAEKQKEIQKSNVKIPYLNFVILGLVSFVIEFIGIVITKI